MPEFPIIGFQTCGNTGLWLDLKYDNEGNSQNSDSDRARTVIVFSCASILLQVFAGAGLVVREVDGPPAPDLVRISQDERDETGPTSFRFYAPRSGKPTKSDKWVYKEKDGSDGKILFPRS